MIKRNRRPPHFNCNRFAHWKINKKLLWPSLHTQGIWYLGSGSGGATQALPVRLKAVEEGNKSLRWLEQRVPGSLQRQRRHGWLLDGWAGSTGAFSTISACCKFLGTLRIAHCQCHLHVLWEIKHLRDLWGKHSWVAKASKGKGCQQTLQNSQHLVHGCSAGEPNIPTARSHLSFCNDNWHMMGAVPHAHGPLHRQPSQERKKPFALRAMWNPQGSFTHYW